MFLPAANHRARGRCTGSANASSSGTKRHFQKRKEPFDYKGDTAMSDGIEALTATLQCERKWRNVQAVLPEALGLVARALAEQTQLILKLQQRVEHLERPQSAVVNSDHMAEMEERVRLDAKRRMSRLRKEFSASFEQERTATRQVKEELETRAQEQQEAINLRCARVEQSLEQQCSKIQERIDTMTESLRHQLKDQELRWKSTRVEDADRLAELRQDLVRRVEGLETKQDETEARIVPVVKEVSVSSPELQESEVDVIRENLERVTEEVRLAGMTVEKQLSSLRQELVILIREKPCKSEVTKLLSRKMDTMDAWKQLAEKADSARVEEVACALMDSIQRSQESTMEDIDQLRRLNESKVDKHNMHNLLSLTESIQHEMSALQRVVGEKMTVADVKELLDSQSTLHGLQEAKKQVESAAAGEFATKSQFDGVSRQVEAITRQLRSEIYQARYIWKNGCPSAKQTIQWSSQVVNTNADVFLWQFGSDEVKLLLPGLYHLQAAFFTNYSPAIQVLVNGEPAAALRPSTDTKDTARSTVIQRVHHSAGNVAGLAVEVFLALPARAHVAISYDIDERAQGFLNLRKL